MFRRGRELLKICRAEHDGGRVGRDDVERTDCDASQQRRACDGVFRIARLFRQRRGRLEADESLNCIHGGGEDSGDTGVSLYGRQAETEWRPSV